MEGDGIIEKKIKDVYTKQQQEIVEHGFSYEDYRKAYEKKERKKKFIYKVIDKADVLFSMIKDSFSGNYKISKKTYVIITAGILYFLTPTDAIFDAIPFIGYIDDIAVINWIYNVLNDEIMEYKQFKFNQKNKRSWLI